MQNGKQKIIKLLKESILISPKDSKNILDKIDSLSEDQIDALLSVFEDAEKKQEKLIKNVLEVNPDFLNSLKEYTKKETAKVRIEQEKKSVTEDSGEIASLDKELEII